jgi:omega-3 fatty acid desaturase (delta-15 desaturase)
MSRLERFGRFSPLALLAWPMYLFKRSPGKSGSHFSPDSPLFTTPEEKKQTVRSSAAVLAMVVTLIASCFAVGLKAVLMYYGLPWLVFTVWLDAVTYLHHHGPEGDGEPVPWYRDDEWSYLRGALSTLDRDYGFINHIHHNIGTHVVHHMFPQIPHDRLNEATRSIKPVLGHYYREPEKAPFGMPVHLLKPIMDSFQNDHVVPESGSVVKYEPYFGKGQNSFGSDSGKSSADRGISG